MGDLNLRQFPDDLHDKLRVEAAKRRTSIKSLIIRAAREWLARANKRPKRKK